jgi:dipeptidyl aminopeptidase/acylaminoacyl peptidase
VSRGAAWLVAALMTAGAAAGVVAGVVRGEAPPVDLLFVRYGAEDAGIYGLVFADGSIHRVVEDAVQPAWSPDGKRIAYLRSEEKDTKKTPRYSLWVAEPDGDGARRIAHMSGGGQATPAWSPDGRTIAFTGDFGLDLIELDSGSRKSVAIGLTASRLQWSPDGTEILYDDLTEIGAVRADGSGARTLREALIEGSPAWSPDGRRIAFSAQSLASLDGKASIVVADADGGSERRLTNGSYDSHPSWSPDGRRIVFARSPKLIGSDGRGELYVIGADGRGLRRLTRNDVDDDTPEWRPARPLVRAQPAPALPLVVVPNVMGEQLDEAKQRLAESGLRGRATEALFGGRDDAYADLRVMIQAPAAGERIPRGTWVQLQPIDASDPFSGRPFDRTVWLAHPDCEGSARARMYADLARILPGKTREAVRRLLGPPRVGSDGWSWPLSAASGFGLDCDYLDVDFDARGRVSRVRHYQS